jgi:hypothetical protein
MSILNINAQYGGLFEDNKGQDRFAPYLLGDKSYLPLLQNHIFIAPSIMIKQ